MHRPLALSFAAGTPVKPKRRKQEKRSGKGKRSKKEEKAQKAKKEQQESQEHSAQVISLPLMLTLYRTGLVLASSWTP